MHLKISVILLYLFTTTLPISHNPSNSINVLATIINSNESLYRAQFRRISTITTTTTITTETCSEPYCYHLLNDTAKTSEKQEEQLAAEKQENYVNLSALHNDTESTHNVLSDIFPLHKRNKRLISSSIVYGLLSVAAQRHEKNRCFNELNQIYEGIHRKEIWAMKVLDSSGTPEPGFVLGQNFWLGSIKGCEAVRKPHKLSLSNRFQRFMHSDLLKTKAPFNIEYRVVYATHKSPWQIQVEFLLEAAKILHIGLCLPTSCSNTEIANLAQKYFELELLDIQSVLDQHPDVLEVKDLNVKTNFLEKTSVQIIGLFILFTIFMMIIAYINEEHKELSIIGSNNNNNNHNDNNIDQNRTILNPSNLCVTGVANEALLNSLNVIVDCKKSSIVTKPFGERFVQCFSVEVNLRALISVKTSPNAVPVIDGLKSIGCFLILVFHMGWYSHYTVHNPAMLFAYGEQALYQWVGVTPIIVDVFFTISGLLLAYNFLKNQSKIREIQTNSFWQNIKLFVKHILHRYIRLTPLYLLVVGLTEIATTYMVETSPFWIHDRYDVVCKKFWWRNVFYIQNLFHVNDLCLSWTWSMACEMQFFILFTALLFVYAKYPNVAKAIFCSLFGIFSGLVLAIALFTKFTPTFDVIHDLGTDLYISPWTRVIPYLVGVGAGYVMYTTNGIMPFRRRTVKILWTAATTIAIMSHISTMHRDISYVIAAPLITAIRIFYSSSVAWMILASAMGHGGLFAKILNFSGFVHVNKLSYGIYLLNPALISVIYGTKDHSTHVDPITMTVMSVGVSTIVYVIAFVFSIMFEMPYTKLSNQLWKRSSTSTIATQQLKKSL